MLLDLNGFSSPSSSSASGQRCNAICTSVLAMVCIVPNTQKLDNGKPRLRLVDLVFEEDCELERSVLNCSIPELARRHHLDRLSLAP